MYSRTMSGIVQIYKNEGETPLECLERFRVEQPLYKDATLSYAGRLDPMAEGILLVLVGAVSYTHLTLPTNREV